MDSIWNCHRLKLGRPREAPAQLKPNKHWQNKQLPLYPSMYYLYKCPLLLHIGSLLDSGEPPRQRRGNSLSGVGLSFGGNRVVGGGRGGRPRPRPKHSRPSRRAPGGDQGGGGGALPPPTPFPKPNQAHPLASPVIYIYILYCICLYIYIYIYYLCVHVYKYPTGFYFM